MADPSQKKSDLYATNMAEDGLPTIVDVGVTHSLADTYFSQNTSVGVRGYAADRYAKSKDTGYKKVIRDNGLQLHSRRRVACLRRSGDRGFEGNSSSEAEAAFGPM